MNFLDKDNLCGQNLIRIVSRGSAIIAELLRMSTNIPEVFQGADKVTDPEQKKYIPILFDFAYLREQEEYERKLNENVDLLDIDTEFQETHDDIIIRFYALFESVWRYQNDFAKFIDDVNTGYYIQHAVDDILQDVEGKQLLCEAIYLYGIMLLFLEDRIPGHVREKLLIAAFRSHGETNLNNFEDVCKLCRNTGYIKGIKKPKNHPENLFARFGPDPEFIRLTIGKLLTDDIYLMSRSFPNPDHRSTRLGTQGSMLFVILYFAPDMLHKQKATMREIVDKHFNDNWVITTYMGVVVDLTVEWALYPAAKSAIENIYNASFVKQLNDKNITLMNKCFVDLKAYLTEGVLQPDYVLDNMENLMNCVRCCNVCLRWRLLHRSCDNKAFNKLITEAVKSEVIVDLLLNTSQLEYVLKEMLQQLLTDKEKAWTDGKEAAAGRMIELSEYFTGEKALTRVKRDEAMMRWFSNLASQISALSMDEQHATATGRTIQHLNSALHDVEQFDVIDTNVQIKSFLTEVREIFRQMIRTVNIKSEVSDILENVSDFSYAWESLERYMTIFHDRIAKDPSSVVLLRATFLKAASILDVPLVRVAAIDSPDVESIAQYYSSELVEFVRHVLEIIPKSVFHVLFKIVNIQANQMDDIPTRLEAKDLKDYAQLELRHELAKLTHEASVFTEGILVMEKTLLGVIEVEPRHILEEGLRRELVRQLSNALSRVLTFKDQNRKEINAAMSKIANTLDGLKRSIEYIQDYIGIAGLKIYQQEITRVMNYFTEQEANRFLKHKTYDSQSRWQSREIPIPKLFQIQESTGSITFMGRVMCAMLELTAASSTIYAPECSAWFTHPAADQKSRTKTPLTEEVCGIRTFSLLNKSLGAIGIRGLDRLNAFKIVYEFNQFLKFYNKDINRNKQFLDQMRTQLFPQYRMVTNPAKFYSAIVKKFEYAMLPMLVYIRRIGQGLLIRKQINNVLKLSCQLDAHMLHQALDSFNRGLLNDIRRHYENPEKFPAYPPKENPVLYEMTNLLEACGLDDPVQKIYITTTPLEGLSELLFIFLLSYLPKLEYDSNFNSLIRKKSSFPLDGIPLVMGVAGLLKQFHPQTTKVLLSYIGQFVRSTTFFDISEAAGNVDNDNGKAAANVKIPYEVLNTIVFVDQLCLYANLPRSLVHEFIPAHIFDTVKVHL